MDSKVWSSVVKALSAEEWKDLILVETDKEVTWDNLDDLMLEELKKIPEFKPESVKMIKDDIAGLITLKLLLEDWFNNFAWYTYEKEADSDGYSRATTDFRCDLSEAWESSDPATQEIINHCELFFSVGMACPWDENGECPNSKIENTCLAFQFVK